MRKILLLEDDQGLNETLDDFLCEMGFFVDTAMDPYSALDLTYKSKYDLYLFDVKLPYESGFELLKKLRNSGDVTPAIFITSKDTLESLKEGFKIGGDDYIKKPFDPGELQCRIEAVLRRQIREEIIQIDEYIFDIKEHKLFIDNEEISLGVKASKLLKLLLEANGSMVSMELIKDRLWSSSEGSSDGSLRVYITNLKKYFGDRIKNIRGVGYCLER
ncbi:MAG: response regulator transcription factor [Campylobacterales bacterium]|nr:response regulator transcription factor [Campylobacterales bacterium]